MKVEKVETPAKFEPVVLMITIETLAELRSMNFIGSLNVSLPAEVYAEAKPFSQAAAEQHKKVAQDLLTQIEKQTRF